MSRYASKSELVEVIKRTAATDYKNLGTPTGIENFNVAGLIRDCKIIGDRRYGWTMNVNDEEFNEAIRRNVKEQPAMEITIASAYSLNSAIRYRMQTAPRKGSSNYPAGPWKTVKGMSRLTAAEADKAYAELTEQNTGVLIRSMSYNIR